MGFVSLRSSALLSQNDNGYQCGTPAIEISVLAVDQEYEGGGVGRALINFVLAKAFELHQQHIGVQCLILAADTKAVGFYQKMGFRALTDRWTQIPKENWSANCIPMSLPMDIESFYRISFITDDDDEDDEC